MAKRIGRAIEAGLDEAEARADPAAAFETAMGIGRAILNRGRRTEPEGQSALPRFNRYSIPHRPRPGEVECPYCVRRPKGAKGLRDHCRAHHPDKPEAK